LKSLTLSTIKDAATISVEDAAVLLSVSRSVAYREIHKGVIPAIRIGRKLRVPVPAFLHLLENPEKMTQ